jgi:hypothetical protein
MAQGGQKAVAVEAAGAAGPARQQNRPRVRAVVKVVYAHSTNLHVQIDDLKIRYRMKRGTPNWAKELIRYVTSHGRHRILKVHAYSRVLGYRAEYENDVYIVKMSLKKLAKIIASSPTWKRSTVANEIIKKINELTSDHE